MPSYLKLVASDHYLLAFTQLVRMIPHMHIRMFSCPNFFCMNAETDATTTALDIKKE